LNENKSPIAYRFRGYLPVVLDLETGGFNAETDAILEMAAVILEMAEDGSMIKGQSLFFNVEPFPGANIEKAALEFTGIDPKNPARMAIPEKDALTRTFKSIRSELKRTGCNRAIMVAHNASFDQAFINIASERNNVKRNPFHPFSSFDTATLCGLAYGQTVLSRACAAAGIEFNNELAHSAEYDCDKTAELFCSIVNLWRELGGLT